MNLLKTMYDEINGVINKRFNEREEMMNKHFDNLNKIMDEGFNKQKNALDKPDEKWEEDRCQLKVESKQVSDNNVVNDSEEIINQVSDNDNEFINNSDKIVEEVVLNSEDKYGDYNYKW